MRSSALIAALLLCATTIAPSAMAQSVVQSGLTGTTLEVDTTRAQATGSASGSSYSISVTQAGGAESVALKAPAIGAFAGQIYSVNSSITVTSGSNCQVTIVFYEVSNPSNRVASASTSLSAGQSSIVKADTNTVTGVTTAGSYQFALYAGASAPCSYTVDTYFLTGWGPGTGLGATNPPPAPATNPPPATTPPPPPPPPAPVAAATTPPPPAPPSGGGGWTAATMTWFGPGDSTSSYNPITTGFGNCLQNSRGSLSSANLAKYSTLYAAINDQGSLFGGGECRPNPNAPNYPICDNQQNCGKCYALRCVRACRGKDTCGGNTCKPGSVTVLMVDACPASSPLQIGLQAQYGWNGCVAAAQSGGNHFDVSPEALRAIVSGNSGEVDIEYQEVPC